MLRRALFVLGIPALLLWGCGGGSEDSASGSVDRQKPGYAKYAFYCGPCHGKDGSGVKPLFPPLHGESWVNLDPEIPISIVLKGLEGRLEMEGNTYMNQMAPLEKRMSDAEIATVLTFVRSSFGNTAGPVTAEEVAAVRARYQDRDKRWTVQEVEARIQDLNAGP